MLRPTISQEENSCSLAVNKNCDECEKRKFVKKNVCLSGVKMDINENERIYYHDSANGVRELSRSMKKNTNNNQRLLFIELCLSTLTLNLLIAQVDAYSSK